MRSNTWMVGALASAFFMIGDFHRYWDSFCMAKSLTACREAKAFVGQWISALRGLAAIVAVTFSATVSAQTGSSPAEASNAHNGRPSSAVVAPAISPWVRVPRLTGRLIAKDVGVVINTADPYSVEVGEFYVQARKLRPEQVLRVDVPVKATLTPEEFDALKSAIDAHFGWATQALALAWSMPYAVNCNSITGALALGFDASLCSQTCAPSRPSPYFNSPSARPYTDLKLRPSMLLAAKDAEGAKSLIERGVAADHSLGLRGALPVQAYFVATKDRARSVRAPLFPPSGSLRRIGLEIHVVAAEAIENVDRVMLYETGAAHVAKLDTVGWVPGALADHLTSFGGRLDGKGGQMSALEWIGSGATASYGTVSEPCSHQQKFPHPQVLLLTYAQGSTAIEAYWKSVAWPLQGVFVGEPLAAPFAGP